VPFGVGSLIAPAVVKAAAGCRPITAMITVPGALIFLYKKPLIFIAIRLPILVIIVAAPLVTIIIAIPIQSV